MLGLVPGALQEGHAVGRGLDVLVVWEWAFSIPDLVFYVEM